MQENLTTILKKNSFLQKEGIVSIKKLTGGLTNESYVVKTQKDMYVCRFSPKHASLLGIDKKRELFNTNQAAKLGIGPKVVHTDGNLMIITYLPGVHVPARTIHSPAFIQAFATTLTKLHSVHTFKGTHDFWKLTKERFSILKKRKSVLLKALQESFKEIEKIRKELSRRPFVSSHVDLTYENILIHQKKIFFIDWEYSAKSDPLIDLAMASVEFDWTEKDEKELLKHYKSAKPISFHELQIAKCIIHFREAIWGAVQHEMSTNSINYAKYTKKKLQKLRAVALSLQD